MVVEVTVIPIARLAEIAEQDLQVVEGYASAQIGIAGQGRLNNHLAGLNKIVVQSGIAAIGISDSKTRIARYETADDQTAGDIRLDRRFRAGTHVVEDHRVVGDVQRRAGVDVQDREAHSAEAA